MVLPRGIAGLSHRPVPDGSTDGGHVHLQEEVAKGRVGWWPPQIKAQSLRQHAVVATSKVLQVPKPLALAQDPEHCHQEQVPGRDAHATPHTGIWDRLEVADQVEIGCGRDAFRHREEAARRPHPMVAAPARKPVPDFQSTLPSNPLVNELVGMERRQLSW